MGDDGIGPHAVTALEVAWELPSEVELLERFGISPRRRGTQESQTIWWEK
jgi:Ni,Fe-hydrogenase maturation factor